MYVTYSGPATMRANQLFRATLEIILPAPMRPGGRLAVAARHVSDFGDAQMDNPAAENYLRVTTEQAGVTWTLAEGISWYRHPWNRGFDLRLQTGELEAGDRITLTLGEGAGFRGQSFVEERFTLRVGVQSRADGEWLVTPIEESPGWPIVGAEPAALRVRVPDVNAGRGTGAVCCKLEDAYGNPTAGDVELALLFDDNACLQRIRLHEGMTEVPNVPLPADGAWHRLTAASDDGRFLTRSNPFGPSLMEGYRLYWGEIHCQSGLCDGTNSPDYLYAYGRQAAGLDFASVTSHDFELTSDDWQQIQEATRRAHRPGSYVTFLGYEWSGDHVRGGDNNVYFLGDKGPLLYCGPCFAHTAWEPASFYVDRTRTLTDVVADLGDTPALIVPHFGGRPANLDYHDPRVMPVMEIHSCHRTYEHMAREALRRGLRVGFIGGSDDHRGALGDSVPTARERFFSARNGLVAVYARELTRASLWEALYARRAYATNGCRMALAFGANGVPMGGELHVTAGDAVQFAFTAILDGLLDRAELCGAEGPLATFIGPGNQHATFSATHTLPAPSGTMPYYLKVYQTDGGVAWSSPVWVMGK